MVILYQRGEGEGNCLKAETHADPNASVTMLPYTTKAKHLQILKRRKIVDMA